MKKLLNILLILTSLIGYLEWGKGNTAFLGYVEYELIFKGNRSTDSFLHPFVIVPLLGQVLLLFLSTYRKPKSL